MYYGYRFYLCCFYYFSVRFWNCSDSVVFVVFLLDFRIVLTVWYFVVFLLDFRIVPPVWYCFVFHCFTEMLINNCIHLISQSICQCQDNAHIITYNKSIHIPQITQCNKNLFGSKHCWCKMKCFCALSDAFVCPFLTYNYITKFIVIYVLNKYGVKQHALIRFNHLKCASVAFIHVIPHFNCLCFVSSVHYCQFI